MNLTWLLAVQVGDIVVAVDHHSVEDMEIDSIHELTFGRENTFGTLQIMRGNRCVLECDCFV